MNSRRVLRLTLHDLWHESWFITASSLIGGSISLFLIPFPFFLAAWYTAAGWIMEDKVVSWTGWLRAGRRHSPFFYRWIALVCLIVGILTLNIYFYGRLATFWGSVLRGLAISLLIIWLLPQPLVPALYLRQEDRRILVALRNAAVICIREPVGIFSLWGIFVTVFLVGWAVGWPIWLLIPATCSLFATRLVDECVEAERKDV